MGERKPKRSAIMISRSRETIVMAVTIPIRTGAICSVFEALLTLPHTLTTYRISPPNSNPTSMYSILASTRETRSFRELSSRCCLHWIVPAVGYQIRINARLRGAVLRLTPYRDPSRLEVTQNLRRDGGVTLITPRKPVRLRGRFDTLYLSPQLSIPIALSFIPVTLYQASSDTGDLSVITRPWVM
jgi:hypothetical protein